MLVYLRSGKRRRSVSDVVLAYVFLIRPLFSGKAQVINVYAKDQSSYAFSAVSLPLHPYEHAIVTFTKLPSIISTMHVNRRVGSIDARNIMRCERPM